MKNTPKNIIKTNGKLDPLFDYSKMQAPIMILDDDDEDVQILAPSNQSPSGLQPTSTGLQNVAFQESALGGGNEVAKGIDDNDWLEPPPSRPGCRRVLPADPTVPMKTTETFRKLRKQKQELKTIYQESLRDIEQAERMEALPAEPLSREQPGGGLENSPSKVVPSKRQKILLRLQGETGEPHGVKICVDEKLEKLFAHYANKVGKRPVTDFVFRFDGQQLNANSCPKDLELEDEDIVEVFVRGARR